MLVPAAADLQVDAKPIETSQAELSTRCPHGFREGAPTNYTARIEINYPREARRKRQEGVVEVRILVGCDGFAKACDILRGSGHEILDNAACADVLERSRFYPARGEDGQAQEASFDTKLRYGLK